MTWFKVCDTFHCHPKAMDASDAALSLWVRAGSWSGQQLSDGRVPTRWAHGNGSQKAAEELVAVGLWHKPGHTCDRCPDIYSGYLFHDWAENNPTREQVTSRREADRIRKASARNPDGVTAGVRTDSAQTAHGFPVGEVGSSKTFRSRPGFRAESARTNQPPSIHALCGHGKEARHCPWCKAESA